MGKGVISYSESFGPTLFLLCQSFGQKLQNVIALNMIFLYGIPAPLKYSLNSGIKSQTALSFCDIEVLEMNKR